MSEFTGLHEDMYRFFWELAFQNHESFYRENLPRYEREVKKPLYALAEALVPTGLKMDPNFNTRISTMVSRLRRDTRYSHDLAPFRDHAWISFRYPGHAVSMSFAPYIEFNREDYGYGMGMYAPDTERMQDIRNRILGDPERFLELLHEPRFEKTFQVDGAAYKKPKFTHENPEIARFLNQRQLLFYYTSKDLKRTVQPQILDECREALEIMTPMYQFLVR